MWRCEHQGSTVSVGTSGSTIMWDYGGTLWRWGHQRSTMNAVTRGYIMEVGTERAYNECGDV